MADEPHQRQLVKELQQAASELKMWLRRMNVSEDEVYQIFEEALRSESALGRIVLDRARLYVPAADGVDISAARMLAALSAIRSGSISEQIEQESSSPLSPVDANQLRREIRDGLANLRDDLANTAKMGPQHRHGGRPVELAKAEQQDYVRQKIRDFRRSDLRLNDCFERVAQELGVSKSKIKQIWYQKSA